MENRFTPNDKLSNLKKAVSEIRANEKRYKDRNSTIKQFDSLPQIERQQLYKKYKGNNHNICFISEYEKLSIMGYFKFN